LRCAPLARKCLLSVAKTSQLDSIGSEDLAFYDCRTIPNPALSLSQAQITALKDLHKSLVSASDMQDESPGDTQGQTHEMGRRPSSGLALDTSDNAVRHEGVWDGERDNRQWRHPSADMHVDEMHSHADRQRPPETPSLNVRRPNTSMGFSAPSEDVGNARGREQPGATSSRYEDILPGSIGRRSAARTPGLMWVSARPHAKVTQQERPLLPMTDDTANPPRYEIMRIVSAALPRVS